MKPVEPIDIKEGMNVHDFVSEMSGMGFGAGKISVARDVLDSMYKDKDCKVFLGVAGAMVPAGMKKVFLKMFERVDVFVTTGANLTHDLIEALGEKHYQGEENADDEELNKKGLDRIYNVYMKNDVYEKLEDFFEKYFSDLKECKNIREFSTKLGEILVTEDLGRDSILRKCYEKDIPIFCPGIADSGIGLMIWGRIAAGKGGTNLDVFGDMNEIIDVAWTAEKRGVIYVGGGLPKNYIQQSLQFSKGAEYGIQITTDTPQGGGSSGAPLKEGISWGKMNVKANFVDVHCDATIALPLILAGLK